MITKADKVFIECLAPMHARMKSWGFLRVIMGYLLREVCLAILRRSIRALGHLIIMTGTDLYKATTWKAEILERVGSVLRNLRRVILPKSQECLIRPYTGSQRLESPFSKNVVFIAA